MDIRAASSRRIKFLLMDSQTMQIVLGKVTNCLMQIMGTILSGKLMSQLVSSNVLILLVSFAIQTMIQVYLSLIQHVSFRLHKAYLCDNQGDAKHQGPAPNFFLHPGNFSFKYETNLMHLLKSSLACSLGNSSSPSAIF